MDRPIIRSEVPVGRGAAPGRREPADRPRRRRTWITRRRAALVLAVTLPLGALAWDQLAPAPPTGLPSDSLGALTGVEPAAWTTSHRGVHVHKLRPSAAGTLQGIAFRPAGGVTAYAVEVWDGRHRLAAATTTPAADGLLEATFAGRPRLSAGIGYVVLYRSVPRASSRLGSAEIMVRFVADGSPAEARPTPTVSPTALPEPSASSMPGPGPAPKRGVNCAPKPSRCGYPDATNTGVPAGTVLRKVPEQVRQGRGWAWDPRGWVAITGKGTVFDGFDVAGTVDVRADGVVVRNSRIRQTGESFGVAVRHADDVTVENCDILAPDAGARRLMVGVKDVYGDARGLRVLRNDIKHTATGIQMRTGLVEGNFVHTMGLVDGDHVNGFTDNGGVTAPLVIRRNTFFNQHGQTDAISLFQDFGAVANRIIDDNLVAGGGYAVYAGAGPRPTSNIKVTNNRFARLYFSASGRWGPITAFESSGRGNVFSGNVWDDTGAPITR